MRWDGLMRYENHDDGFNFSDVLDDAFDLRAFL